MQKTILVLCAVFLSSVSLAQLKTTPLCPEFNIDLLDGIINRSIVPNSTVGQIKSKFPCYSSFEEENTSAKCGGGVFYKEKDIYFYTTRDYIEIGPAFKGKLSLPLMGAARNGLFKLLGSPKVKDVNWDAFQTNYGVLIVYYNKAARVNKIQFSKMSVNTIQLCE